VKGLTALVFLLFEIWYSADFFIYALQRRWYHWTAFAVVAFVFLTVEMVLWYSQWRKEPIGRGL